MSDLTMTKMSDQAEGSQVLLTKYQWRTPLDVLKIANKTLSFLFLIVPESLLLSVLLTFATDLGLPSHLMIGKNIQSPLNSCTLNWQM